MLGEKTQIPRYDDCLDDEDKIWGRKTATPSQSDMKSSQSRGEPPLVSVLSTRRTRRALPYGGKCESKLMVYGSIMDPIRLVERGTR